MKQSRESSCPEHSAGEQIVEAAHRRPYQAPNLRIEALHAVVRGSAEGNNSDNIGFRSS